MIVGFTPALFRISCFRLPANTQTCGGRTSSTLEASGAPLEHTSETNCSVSLQAIVSIPVRMRKPSAGLGSPCVPAGPEGPGGPGGPCGPGRRAGLRVPWGLGEATLGTLRADSALRGQEDLPRLSGQRNLAAQQALADPGHLAVQQDQAVQEVLQVPRVRPHLQVLADLVCCIQPAQPLRR